MALPGVVNRSEVLACAWKAPRGHNKLKTIELRRDSERQIIRAVGDQFVAEGFANIAALEQKCPGHALHIACRKAQKVTVEPRTEHSRHAFQVQILAELGTHQALRLL